MNASDAQYQVESSPLPGTQRVFAATRVEDGGRVVVKRPRGRYPTAEEVAVLRHEFNVLSRLQGAAVPDVQGFSHDGGTVGLVMARAPGRSMDAIISDGPLDVLRCVTLALGAARALGAVHARGYVHRDVKPQHFFVDETTSETLLVDFGLATHLPRERHLPVELDRLQGTLAYISPEQTGRTNQSVDRRSDLYSLGVALYELCTGKRPFENVDALELLHAHIARQPTPPRQHRPELPPVLEAIILRLLAKSPSRRYQTAEGLARDLERVHRECSNSGSASAFELGQHDHDGELRVPEKLYGRASHREALLSMVRRAQRGERTLVLVAGPPGVGKSALVQEVHREVARRGHFVSGKFDQYSRGIPYSALATACAELVRVYLASSAAELDAWRTRLRSALGENAKVVIDVVPELVLALGEQPEVAQLPPNEAQIRFERTFRRFMEASACERAPLVLFLDDLQWADSASLAVLELVLSSDAQGHLLLIGNYRDNEVDVGHPLLHLLERLEASVPIERIELEPLSREDVIELVTDALTLTEQNIQPLADLIFEKTSGNPFFIGQFLERLAAEGALAFEAGRGYFWDLDAIAALDATDNVVDLVVRRLGALEPRAQELLRLAACIGHTFRLRTLSVIAGAPPWDVARALAAAVSGGYLLPLDRNHHLLENLLEADANAAVDTSYRFVHDRVQQAALSTIDATQRARVHLRIGRLLLTAAGKEGPTDDQLFEIVAQLNLGRQHIDDRSDRLHLARLNLRAAQRAESAAAHHSAIELAAVCLELLGPEPFETDHETSLAAHQLSAESHFLAHDDQRSLELIGVIEEKATEVLERVPARNLKTTIITNQGRPVEASAIGIETIALLGVALPDPHDADALGPAIGEAFGAYQAALGAREVASLLDLPPMTDPEKLALVSTFAGTIPSAFQWNPNLMVLLVLQAVRLPLEYGTAPISPFFYAQYGIVHHVVTSDRARAHDFGTLALELARRPAHAASRGGVEFIYAEFLAPWMRPRSECSLHFQKAIVAGLDAGDQLHAAYAMAVGVAEGFYAGQQLTELEQQCSGYMKALVDQGDVLNQMLLSMVGRAIACLRGTTTSPGSLDGDGFSEDAFEAESPPPVKAHYGAVKGLVRFVYGDPASAYQITEAVSPPPGVGFQADCVFYHGMACAELARGAEGEERENLLSKANADLKLLAEWAPSCPANFLALEEMLRAEVLVANDETVAALDAHERALTTATEAANTHHLAFAHERAGRLHLRAGRKQLALLNLSEACRHYVAWGATGKVQQLREEFPQAPHARTFAAEPADHSATIAETVSSNAVGGSRLDLTSAMRAVKAIAGEIRLEPLLRRLMGILLENAGATRGVLLLSGQEGLKVRAELRMDPDEVFVDMNEPLEATRIIAQSIVRYSARTNEPVVLDDASRDHRFAQDPFVEQHQPKSITCTPLLHQAKLVGVLYLENDTATGVFHAARIERLEFLAGHTAVSLQNAGLYERLEAANENLERRVHERTAELSERNQDMRRVLDNVKQGLLTLDLDGRLASERSRVVSEWLGDFEPKLPFRDYMGRVDLRFAQQFEFAFDQMRTGFLPEKLMLSQLPTRFERKSRQFEVSYEPIRVDGKISGLLVVIDDMTDALRRARDEAEQKEVLALCGHLSKDRSGLVGFFDEARAIVDELLRASTLDITLRRNLHTLKGNAGLFGFGLLAHGCDVAEQAIADGVFERRHIDSVVDRFNALRATLGSIAGDDISERVEVSRSTLRALAQKLDAGMPAGEASRSVEQLLLEPLGVSLGRLGKYARVLGARFGKRDLRVEVDDGGLLVNRDRAAALFAALVHLVRNAVDHGLESREACAASGKGAASLWLSANMPGSEVCISIRDDGRGIDWDRICELAAAEALPCDSQAALVDALFAAELSTCEQATGVSGRGVGLTAVREEVERLSGRIEVESAPGKGAEFRVLLPAEALGIRSNVPETQRRVSIAASS